MSLNPWQKAHAKQLRCVTCGHNNEANPEAVALCECCPTHCSGCSHTTTHPVLDVDGVEAYTTSKCKCCVMCSGFPCKCHRITCPGCTYPQNQCGCCSICDSYPCCCHEDCEEDCPSCNGGYSPNPFGRGSHGSTLTPPWTKDGIVVDGRTHDKSYNNRWRIDHSINPATAAADFYLTEAIKHGLPNPVRKAVPALAAAPITVGVGAWGRLVTGLVALSSDAAVVMHKDGQPVILVREMTTPEDIHGMKAADGILTTTGGTSSHAAVVARGWNKTCVVGAADIKLRYPPNIREGDEITIDGSTGAVYRGRITPVSLAAQTKLNGFLAPGGITDEDYYDESNVLNCYTPSHQATTYATNGRSFEITSDGVCSEVVPVVDYQQDQRRLASIMDRSGLLRGEDLDAILEEAHITHEVLVAWYAENFRKAAHCAIGGELRHHRCIGGEVLNANQRSAAWTGWIDVIEKVGVDRALRTAEALFMEMGGSYGGSRWAASAEALRMYETGELTPALWVDRVMSLTHNGGMLLDKIRWQGTNSKGFGIAHMVDHVLPAHGTGNYKLLLKLASPRVVELWNRYWDAANRARVLNGQAPQPNTAGTIQPPRHICSGCSSKPWIGHHANCYIVRAGYPALRLYNPDDPIRCGYVYVVDEDSFDGYNWDKWTDGPYYYDATGKPNEVEKQTRSKPVVEVEYGNPGYSAKAETVTITSTPAIDPDIELLLLEEALIEAQVVLKASADALEIGMLDSKTYWDIYKAWLTTKTAYDAYKKQHPKGGK